YAITALGVPLPLPAAKDRSVPFPCQDRACGCRSATECWQNCCCFSREEHLAWARAHQVEPPAGYAEGGWNTQPKRAQAGCCQTRSTCCAGPTGHCCTPKPNAPRQAASGAKHPAPRYVIGTQMLRCRGLAVIWVQAGAALPPPLPQRIAFDCPLVSVLGLQHD